jgi:hypothetical protein
MDVALVGAAALVAGTLLGGTGKYFSLRRDAWREARTSGLLLLADVRAIRAAQAPAPVVSDARLMVESWKEEHRRVLAGFRRGMFPHGLVAPEWLTLAGHFTSLERLCAEHRPGEDDDRWRSRAGSDLAGAEGLLARFENDPPVVGYVCWAAFRRILRSVPRVTRRPSR